MTADTHPTEQGFHSEKPVERPVKKHGRRQQKGVIRQTAEHFGLSYSTVYRASRAQHETTPRELSPAEIRLKWIVKILRLWKAAPDDEIREIFLDEVRGNRA